MSPSKFLSFSRHVASRPALQTRLARLQPLRPFSSSVTRFSSGGNLSTDDSVKTDQFPDSEHATDKKDKLDVQSENSAKGKEAKARDEGGTATSQSDSRANTARAKQEHPEAPDVVIGMQDERGGKGH